MRIVFDVVVLLLAFSAPILAQEVQPVVQSRVVADPVVAEQDSNAKFFSFVSQEDRLSISFGKQAIADFVFQDPKILRPYFSNLKTSDGQQVTRNHPPREGQDAMDHDTMHPGIWLAFGDISGNDFWRNKASVVHRVFSEKPVVSGNELRFTTESDMLGTDGRVLSVMTNRIRLLARPAGWMIVWAATFQAERDIVFGDQEEMGFGARVATELTEKNGGTMLNSKGLASAAKTWGQPSVWCDYYGTVAEREMGVMLMASSANFRESWWHNRNYGLMVANPFGRKAMKQGELSAVLIKQEKSLELTFGALIHSGPGLERDAEYAHFAEAIRKPNISPTIPME
ncbi:MAG: DUF6807 family protein [Pirellula sp.]|jgi:hypothetical protein|nr:PmoA family protein [Pirellula sp.]